MAEYACLGPLLSWMWGLVKDPVEGFLRTAVADCLTYLRENLPFFRGNQVVQVLVSSVNLVGTEEIQGYLRQIKDHLRNEKVGVIGIYAMGGSGKTTLLEIINNKFPELGVAGFDEVIWVTVSGDADVLNIQKQIGDRLGLSLLSADPPEGSSSQAGEQSKVIPAKGASWAEQRAAVLFNALSKRRFLLLLDDVWEKLNLKDIGIPLPSAENKCKIVLTSRSRQVCNGMDAGGFVEIKGLNDSDAWKLFKEKVGVKVDLESPFIKPHAEAVMKKCGGLPLALKTVGAAMADAATEGEWEEALDQLRRAPHELGDMEVEVLSLLQLSFQRLKDERTKQCLLYCCLFQEDKQINVEDLIEYWVGEGLLDVARSDSIIGARNRGRGTVTKLVSACLLESVDQLTVKLHDVVREMCLWLTRGELDQQNTFLIDTSNDLTGILRFEKWGDVRRISIMRPTGWLSSHAPEYLWPSNVPLCPNLQTLLLVGAPYRCVLRQGFFDLMPALRVLDLGDSGISSLPDEISALVALRYLKLRGSLIESLPKGLGRLTKLRQLDLQDSEGFSHMPREAITTLTSLQSLRLFNSLYGTVWPDELANTAVEGEAEASSTASSNTAVEGEAEASSTASSSSVSLRDMDTCLVQLEELMLDVRTLACLRALLSLDRLCRSTTYLNLHAYHGPVDVTSITVLLSTAFERMENLQTLHVTLSSDEPGRVNVLFDGGSRLGRLEELHLGHMYQITVVDAALSPPLFGRLRVLSIRHCHGIRDVAWVGRLPCLEFIDLDFCHGIEELLLPVDGLEGGSDDGFSPGYDSISLQKLKTLKLRELPQLKSINKWPMLLPSLEVLYVRRCPQLKKLPFGPDSAKNKLRSISGGHAWWARLDWWQDRDGRSIQPRFLPYFYPLRRD